MYVTILSEVNRILLKHKLIKSWPVSSGLNMKRKKVCNYGS